MSAVLWTLIRGECSPPVLLYLGPFHEIPQTVGSNIDFSQFWGWKSETRVPAWSAPGESPLPGWQMAALRLCPHVAETVSSGLPLLTGTPVLSQGTHPHVLI